jgi:hypothetical protein
VDGQELAGAEAAAGPGGAHVDYRESAEAGAAVRQPALEVEAEQHLAWAKAAAVRQPFGEVRAGQAEALVYRRKSAESPGEPGAVRRSALAMVAAVALGLGVVLGPREAAALAAGWELAAAKVAVP